MKAIVVGQMLVVFLLTCTGDLHSDELSERLAELDGMLADGDWNCALVAARQLRDNLPAEKRVTAWELDFRGEVSRAVLGDRCLYYQLSIPNSEEQAPGRQHALPSIKVIKSDSEWSDVVVCVDLTNGKVLWSRAVEGRCELAVAPKTDALYLWGERLICLDSATGDPTLKHDFADLGTEIQGLKFGDTVPIPQTQGNFPKDLLRSTFSLFDPDRNAYWHGDLGNFYLLAPNRSRRMVPTEDSWQCVDPVSGNTLWKSTTLNLSRPPLWLDDSVVTYPGLGDHGTVRAIVVETGQSRWSAPLGWGAYSTRYHQLRARGYPDDDWRPMGIVDKYIMALDDSGRFVLIDRNDGSIQHSVRLAQNHLREPRLVKDTLVVCSFDWVRAFPLTNLLNPGACAEAICRLGEARCLHALERPKEALSTIDALLERAPNYREGWTLRAEICRKLNLDDEISFSLCNALALAGSNQDAALRDGWGLVRLFDLKAKPTWQVQQLNRNMYVSTLPGKLWSVSLDSLEATLAKQFVRQIESLYLPSDLQATGGDSRKIPETLKLDKPGPHPSDGIPSKW